MEIIKLNVDGREMEFVTSIGNDEIDIDIDNDICVDDDTIELVDVIEEIRKINEGCGLDG